MSPPAYDLVFRRERETKNKIRFEEIPDEGAEPVVRTLYVDKSADARLGNPARMRMTLSAE